MSIVRWSPFPEFDSVFRGIDQNTKVLRRADWVPLVDIRENEQAFTLEVEVPSVAAGDLSVSVAEGLLSVTGKSQSAEDGEESNLHRSERLRGSFSRSFTLPESVDVESISAEIKEGVLYLKVPKKLTLKHEVEIKVLK
jgi:HSP20 family protein